MTIIYLENPPDSVPCLYCNEQCKQGNRDFYYSSTTIYGYYCDRHPSLVIMFSFVQHAVPSPNWFFNAVRITYNNNLRIDLSCHSGNGVWLEKFIPAEDHKWGPHWRAIDINTKEISMFDPIKQIASYLKLFKVWS